MILINQGFSLVRNWCLNTIVECNFDFKSITLRGLFVKCFKHFILDAVIMWHCVVKWLYVFIYEKIPFVVWESYGFFIFEKYSYCVCWLMLQRTERMSLRSVSTIRKEYSWNEFKSVKVDCLLFEVCGIRKVSLIWNIEFFCQIYLLFTIL